MEFVHRDCNITSTITHLVETQVTSWPKGSVAWELFTTISYVYQAHWMENQVFLLAFVGQMLWGKSHLTGFTTNFLVDSKVQRLLQTMLNQQRYLDTFRAVDSFDSNLVRYANVTHNLLHTRLPDAVDLADHLAFSHAPTAFAEPNPFIMGIFISEIPHHDRPFAQVLLSDQLSMSTHQIDVNPRNMYQLYIQPQYEGGTAHAVHIINSMMKALHDRRIESRRQLRMDNGQLVMKNT
jgi:hypothetical protein